MIVEKRPQRTRTSRSTTGLIASSHVSGGTAARESTTCGVAIEKPSGMDCLSYTIEPGQDGWVHTQARSQTKEDRDGGDARPYDDREPAPCAARPGSRGAEAADRQRRLPTRGATHRGPPRRGLRRLAQPGT